jgi:hypothetical protein
MSDVLDDPQIVIKTSGLAVGLGTEEMQLGLQSNVLSAALEDDPISGVLETKNLVIRLYSPDGSTLGTDFVPFFKGDPGGLTQADKDLLEKAVIDAVIAKAVAQAQITAETTANAVLQAEVEARQLADSIFEAEITEEKAIRQTNEESVAIKINTVGARIDANVAAIQDEQLARADAESALSERIEQVVATTAANTVAINETKIAYADADTAIGKRIDVVVADVGQNTASILDEQEARADADSALSTRITQVEAHTDVSSAAITSLQTALAAANQSNASAMLALTTTLNGHTSTINVQQSSINGVYANYAVKIDNNGYVSGFGLYSTAANGAVVSYFNILADRFTVQLPGYPGVQPFWVGSVNGVPQVCITNAAIGDATITNAKIADAAITNAKIADASITNAKIGDAQITTAKIGFAQVDTLRIGNNAVSTLASWGGFSNNQSVTYQSVGGDIIIFIGALCLGTGNPEAGTRVPGILQLKVNGSVQATLQGDQVQAGTFVRLGAWAAQVITITLSSAQGGFTGSTVALLEAKR